MKPGRWSRFRSRSLCGNCRCSSPSRSSLPLRSERANNRLSLLARHIRLRAPFFFFLLQFIESTVRMAPHLIRRRLCHRFRLIARTPAQHENAHSEHDAGGSLQGIALTLHTRPSLQCRTSIVYGPSHHTLPEDAKPPAAGLFDCGTTTRYSPGTPQTLGFLCHCATVSPKISSWP